jgi:hypothetical protein
MFRVEEMPGGDVSIEFVIPAGRHRGKDLERAARILSLLDLDEGGEAETPAGMERKPYPEEAKAERERAETRCSAKRRRNPEEAKPEREPEAAEPGAVKPKAADNDHVGESLRRHRPEDRVRAAEPAISGRCRGINGAAHVLCHSRQISKTLEGVHGGAFGVYDVDSEGYILPVRHLPDERKMGTSRGGAVERFREWADKNFCRDVRIFRGEEAA